MRGRASFAVGAAEHDMTNVVDQCPRSPFAQCGMHARCHRCLGCPCMECRMRECSSRIMPEFARLPPCSKLSCCFCSHRIPSAVPGCVQEPFVPLFSPAEPPGQRMCGTVHARDPVALESPLGASQRAGRPGVAPPISCFSFYLFPMPSPTPSRHASKH